MRDILSSCHAILPTGGTGSRLGGAVPKQLRVLAGKPMLAFALEALIATPEIESIWVGVSPSMHAAGDFAAFQESSSAVLNTKPNYFLPTGGPTRQETVLNTLRAMLDADVPGEDWILVHDAARPGITSESIQDLIHGVLDADTGNPLHGGILAMPVADTLKQGIEGGHWIEGTISREAVWQAQTPQMFRLADLYASLESALSDRASVTDEASAVERLGGKPILIKGSTRNFKVTHQADWELMELVLRQQEVHTR
jgi:2-C-methyl-D-erythritol 4-phosphate cytidylyltransferase